MLLYPIQVAFLALPDAPLIYWLSENLITLFRTGTHVQDVAAVRKGLDTADNDRFVRIHWEGATLSGRWWLFPKGGGYAKWYGRSYHLVDWQGFGARIKAIGRGTPRNEAYYGQEGLTYTEFGRGNLGVRVLEAGAIFNTSSP